MVKVLGSQKVAGKSCIKTENSQVAVIGYLYIHTSCVVIYILIQVRRSQETSHNENSLGNFYRLHNMYILYYTYQYTIAPIYTIV